MALANPRPRRSQATPVVPDAEIFVGDETISIPTTVGGTALASVPANCRHAYIYVTSGTVVLRPTSGSLGGAPTSTVGVQVAGGSGFDYTGDPTLLKLIGVGAAATVYAVYFGEP